MPRGRWRAVPLGGWPTTIVSSVRLASGAVPPQAARPLGRAAGVLRPVCPGCGGCGCRDAASAPQRRRCALWGWREGVPRGSTFRRCGVGGVWVQAFPLSRLPALWAGCRVHYPLAVGVGVWVWGPSTIPLACMSSGGCVPQGWWGAVPGGGWPATVVRGVWCQAVSLSRPPAPWGGQPGFRDPCIPGAVGAGVRTQQRPQSVRPCGPALRAVGVAEGRPRGGCLSPLLEVSAVRRFLSWTAHPLGGLSGPVTHVLWARVCGCGGPALSPWLACPVGATCRGAGGGPSPGGLGCYRCQGRLASGAVPFPAARPPGRAAGVPRPVCPGCGWCGLGPATGPTACALAGRVARCGAGGRASPGGVPCAVVRGV